MTQAKHSNQSPTNGGIHVIHAFEYADASARNAATFTSADIGKVVRQIDNDTFYIVTGSGSGSSVFDSLSGGSGGGSVSDDDPVNVNAAIADPGIDGYASRSDHKHSIDTATAVSVGAANAEGTSNSVARADHTHAVTDLSITDQEQGSTLYFDGSNWAQLPPGDDGYVLTSNGVGADPTWEASAGGGGGVSDHGALTGLNDDDHTQYLLVDGTRAMTGNINVGGNNITNVGTVDGVDISSHAARHITGAADEIDGDQLDIDFTPSNYTPSIAPVEATNLDHLTAHLSGIDTSLGTIVTDHGGLSGLADDDHTQYLLEDGTRAMSGALNMGTNNITNVGAVDGVDVSAHATRHLPSGADPLTTASAVSVGSANAEGSAESFARSDHTHEVTDLVITSQEQGSVLYFNGSNWSQLSPGIDGYVLYTQGSGADPFWDGYVIRADGSVNFSDIQSHNNNDIVDIKTASFFEEVDDGYAGTSLTIDWNDGQKQRISLDDNCTLTFFDPPGACNVLLKVVQDNIGSRTVVWPNNVLWPGGTAPTLSIGGGAIDIVSLYYDGLDYYGVASLDFI